MKGFALGCLLTAATMIAAAVHQRDRLLDHLIADRTVIANATIGVGCEALICGRATNAVLRDNRVSAVQDRPFAVYLR